MSTLHPPNACPIALIESSAVSQREWLYIPPHAELRTECKHCASAAEGPDEPRVAAAPGYRVGLWLVVTLSVAEIASSGVTFWWGVFDLVVLYIP